jgi:hypothetical protein
MDIDDFRVSRRVPFAACIPEIADELLLLGVDGYDWLTALFKGDDLHIDDSKLLVPMWVLRSFELFASALKREMKTLQLTVDCFPADSVSVVDQFILKMSNTFRCPADTGLRVTCNAPSQRLSQGANERWVGFPERLTATSRTTHPRPRPCRERMSRELPELTPPLPDRLGIKASRPAHQRRSSHSQAVRLGSSPEAPRPLIDHPGKLPELSGDHLLHRPHDFMLIMTPPRSSHSHSGKLFCDIALAV